MIRRGVTLIEAIICVVVLAISVPPTLGLLGSVTADRADAVNTTRAAMLAELVLETCLADAVSPDPSLGFEAFADGDGYRGSLNARLATLAEPYTRVGMGYRVSIGPLVDATGGVNPDAARNIFRVITVTVTYPSSSGDPFELPVSVMVGEV